MDITVKTTTETVIKVTGVPTSWEALEGIKKGLKTSPIKDINSATVEYLHDERNEDGSPIDGFKITTYTSWNHQDGVRRIVEKACADAKNKLDNDKALNIAFVENFKFRNIGDLKARGRYQKKIQEILVLCEEDAKQAKRKGPPEEAYYSMFDMPAYYAVWDAVRNGGAETAATVAQNQDTAVREVFGEFFDLLEEEGKDW